MRALMLAFLLSTSPLSYSASITIGVLPFNPPFEMEADKGGHFYGFDIDIMTSICQRLSLECQFVSASLPELFTMLSIGKIDLAMGTISITPKREETFIFSLPYLASYGYFLTKKNTKFNAVSDIEGTRVGVIKGQLYKPLAMKIFNHNVKIIEFRTSADVFEALKIDEVDAAFLDEGAAKYWVASNNMLRLIGEHYKIGIGYGIMAQKNQSILINQINQALMDIEADGTYIKIYNLYFSQLIKSE